MAVEKYRAIGLMSGSSLDGLDIACCDFTRQDGHWKLDVIATDVVPYPSEWIQVLKDLPTAPAKTFWEKHIAIGHYFGKQVADFIQQKGLQNINIVASHGHTVFHFPDKQFTTQIADGAAIAAQSKLPVACDFRSADMASGGQGTPIVPIGDLLLFNEYKLCLNIGGIANISCKLPEAKKSIVAFDICAANQVLNTLANSLHAEYDDGGQLARNGKLHEGLLQALNGLPYYQLPYPKSLDNSYSKEVILPLLEKFEITAQDKLRTYTEHIAIQVAAHINLIAQQDKVALSDHDKMLVTGGGAFNKFLIERLSELTSVSIEVPDDELVKFKEAIVIALMGVLRMRNEVNVLGSVTGAGKNTVGGALYLP